MGDYLASVTPTSRRTTGVLERRSLDTIWHFPPVIWAITGALEGSLSPVVSSAESIHMDLAPPSLQEWEVL